MNESMPIMADRCMNAVRDHVGTVELEAFIYYVRSQSFDYTKWQQEHYDAIDPDALFPALEKHSAQHPFKGKKAVIL